MLTLAEIRARYPNPIRDKDAQEFPDGYCVGGALVACVEDNPSRFPCETHLAAVLQKLHPALDDWHATFYAQHIIVFNDRGVFEDAWSYAAQALSY